MPDYDQLTTVYAGDKHLIELKVKANTRIRWAIGINSELGKEMGNFGFLENIR